MDNVGILATPSRPFNPNRDSRTSLCTKSKSRRINANNRNYSNNRCIVSRRSVLILRNKRDFVKRNGRIFYIRPPFMTILINLNQVVIGTIRNVHTSKSTNGNESSSNRRFTLIMTTYTLAPKIRKGKSRTICPFRRSKEVRFKYRRFPRLSTNHPYTIMFRIVRRKESFTSPNVVTR